MRHAALQGFGACKAQAPAAGRGVLIGISFERVAENGGALVFDPQACGIALQRLDVGHRRACDHREGERHRLSAHRCFRRN